MKCVCSLTTISCKSTTVELFRQNHGRPAEISAVIVNCLPECKLFDIRSELSSEIDSMLSYLAISHHRSRGIQWSAFGFGDVKKFERTEECEK